jgi:hypothetical protein
MDLPPSSFAVDLPIDSPSTYSAVLKRARSSSELPLPIPPRLRMPRRAKFAGRGTY